MVEGLEAANDGGAHVNGVILMSSTSNRGVVDVLFSLFMNLAICGWFRQVFSIGVKYELRDSVIESL